MKIVAKAAMLANALTLAAMGMRANKKPLAHIGAADGVVITCADPHISIKAEAAATVIEPGQLAVSAERLCALVCGFAPGATVTIEASESAALITCGNSRSRLPIFPATDLPPMLAIDGEIASVEISGSDCLTLLEPLSAAGGDVSRFFLCGIFLQSVGEKLVGVCTNGTQLSRVSVPAGEFSTGRDLIVPTEAVLVLRRLVTRTKPKVITLRRSKRLLAVTGPDFEFTSRLIDYTFPAYERLIPPTAPNAVSVIRMDLLAAMSRLAAVAAADPPPLVALSWTNTGLLTLFLARQPDDGADTITATQCNGVAKIAIPLSQLIAMIGELKGERVHLEAAEGQPLVIKCEAEKLALITQSTWHFRDSETAEAA